MERVVLLTSPFLSSHFFLKGPGNGWWTCNCLQNNFRGGGTVNLGTGYFVLRRDDGFQDLFENPAHFSLTGLDRRPVLGSFLVMKKKLHPS